MIPLELVGREMEVWPRKGIPKQLCESDDGKGQFQQAEDLFKKTLNLKPVHPHSCFGLALLYRVTGHPEESLKVLERFFILMPKTPGIESAQIYNEARNLYSEIKAGTEPKTSTHYNRK